MNEQASLDAQYQFWGTKEISTRKTISRDMSVDIAKGIAILSVIAYHSGFPLTLWINPSTFFLVIFFLISGFFINTEISAFEFIKQKMKLFIIPYYCFFFVYSIFYYFFIPYKFPQNYFSIPKLIIEPFTSAQPFDLVCPLWFIVALFEGCVLVAFIRPVLKKSQLTENGASFQFYYWQFLPR